MSHSVETFMVSALLPHWYFSTTGCEPGRNELYLRQQRNALNDLMLDERNDIKHCRSSMN